MAIPDLYQATGLIAGALTTVAFVPQVWKIWRERSAEDISYGMFAIFSLGVFMWFVYGLFLHAWPIIIANGITFVLSVAVIVLKVRFERPRPQ